MRRKIVKVKGICVSQRSQMMSYTSMTHLTLCDDGEKSFDDIDMLRGLAKLLWLLVCFREILRFLS